MNNTNNINPVTIKDAKDLENVLQQLLVPDNTIIKLAELSLKQFTQNSQCITAFVQQIQSSANFGVRQIAAVILRAKIKVHWEQLDHNSKEFIKSSLLDVLIKEVDPRVRSSVVSVVGEVASYEVPFKRWDQLAVFMTQCVKMAQSAYREVGMFLLSALVDSCGDQMKENIHSVVQMMQAGLADESFTVKMASLKAVQSFVLSCEDESQMDVIIPMIPLIIEVIKQCLTANQDAVALSAFEIFDELVEKKSTSLDASIPPMMQFMLEIAVNTRLDMEVRERATTFIGWVIAFKPKIVIKQKMVPTLINVAFKMLVEPEDDDADESDLTGYRTGSSLLDELAVGVPSKHVFQSVVTIAAPLTSSQNHFERKAGVTAFGLIAEGCHQPMRVNLAQAVPIVVKACHDQHRQVREAASLALASFSEYLRPEIMDYYQQIVPVLIEKLDDPTFEVREKAGYTLDLFCQNLGERVAPFLQDIMNKLMKLLTGGDIRTQEVVLPVIAGAAVASKQHFLPYYTHLLPLMKQILEDKRVGDELLLLRGNAIECVGLIALAVGKNNFAPYIEAFMSLALNNMQQIDKAEMREYTYRFFENIASTLQADFSHFLSAVVPAIITTIENDEVLQRVAVNDQAQFNFEDEEDEEDDEDSGFRGHFTVRTSQLEEKAAAISSLAAIALATKQNFLPFLEKAIEIFVNDSTYFHYTVRRNAILGLKNVLYVVIPTTIKTSGEILNENQLALLNKVMLIFTTTLLEDDDKETVAVVCESISQLCVDFGRKIVDGNIDTLCSALTALIAQKCPCNNNNLDEDDGADHDILLIDAVSDAIDDIARVVGPEFANQFRYILPELLKYVGPNRDAGDKMMGLGTMAECSNAMASGAAPFLKDMLPFAFAGIKDANMDVKRNAIFMLGVLAYHLKPHFEASVMQLLGLLHPIFSNIDKYSNVVVDNACGAIARIIKAQYQIPLEQVLPVFIQSLPLREDFDENEVVYSSILSLLQSGNPAIAQCMKETLTMFAKVISADTTQLDVKNNIIQVLRQFKQQFGAQVAQVLSQCDTQTQQIIGNL